MKTSLVLSLFSALLLLAGLPPGGRAADAGRPTDAEREEFLRNFKRIGLNTTPGDAMMLRILVQTAKARRGVEVGTATGYGALHMGVAFERNGGQLITVDIDPKMVQAARDNLKAMGLEKTVTVIEGDALKVLPALEGEFDFVFIDALKEDYLKYFQALAPKLKKGALVVADNVIRSARQMQDFLDAMEKDANYEKVTIRASMEKNDGMAIYLKVR
jgi:predicted O-methyltransferase YrrM